MGKKLILPLLLSSLAAAPAAAQQPCPSGAAAMQFKTPASAGVEGARTYPNPWRSDQNAGQQITFEAAVGLNYVMLFTTSGRWVRTLHCGCFQTTVGWDLKNSAGESVRSGYYVYLMRDTFGRQTRGTVAVMR